MGVANSKFNLAANNSICNIRIGRTGVHFLAGSSYHGRQQPCSLMSFGLTWCNTSPLMAILHVTSDPAGCWFLATLLVLQSGPCWSLFWGCGTFCMSDWLLAGIFSTYHRLVGIGFFFLLFLANLVTLSCRHEGLKMGFQFASRGQLSQGLTHLPLLRCSPAQGAGKIIHSFDLWQPWMLTSWDEPMGLLLLPLQRLTERGCTPLQGAWLWVRVFYLPGFGLWADAH